MNISTKRSDILLPYLVVEALASQTSSFPNISVQITDKGWAWLVCGRRLIIWKFSLSASQAITTRSRRTLSPSFELQLPQSDLKHKADLMHVTLMPQDPNMSFRMNTLPAALGVSPEGVIRYWASIGNERFTETSVADIQGQEFCSLFTLTPTEHLLGTTTGSVFVLKIDLNSSNQKDLLTCSPLASQSSLLSGISRRMTSLFFGPMTSDAKTEFRKPLFASNPTDRTFFVLESSFKLRQWCRATDGTNNHNQLLREWDLLKNLQTKLCTKLGVTELDQIQFWPVDMVSTRSKELLILVTTLNKSRDNIVNYAAAVFNPYQAGDRLTKTTVLRSHSWTYTNGCDEQLFALRFVERCVTSATCFIYDRKFLFLAQVDGDILDAIDYANQEDGILGAGYVERQCIVFTQRDGLTNCSYVKRQEEDRNESALVRNNTTLNSTRPFVSETMHEDSVMTAALDTTEANESQQSRIEVIDRSKEQPPTPKPLNQSTRENSTSEIDLVSNKEFEWIQHIDNRRYGFASDVLAKLAEESELLQDRKETLIALSKLARLAE